MNDEQLRAYLGGIREVLLLTGSRSFAGSPQTFKVAWDFLEGTLREATERGYTLLVVGDAPGVDAMGSTLARSLDLPLDTWSLSGRVKPWTGEPWPWTAQGVPPRGSREYRHWPLVRNAAMAALCGRAKTLGLASVRCVGLVDPSSITHGTEHTVHAAEKEGIDTELYRLENNRLIRSA